MAGRDDIVKGYLTPVDMGLGSAIRRFMDIEFKYRMAGGRLAPDTIEEREMLLAALDALHLNLGFDCNGDGIPDTVDIFKQAASTSCCRLLPHGSKAVRVSKERKKTTRKKTPRRKTR